MPFWTLRRRLALAGLVALLLAVGWAAVVLAVAVTATRDQATTSDAIVVLGAAQYNGRPSPVFRARLDHAAALYQRGLAPVVLVTGGVGAGDSVAGAEGGRRCPVRAGLLPFTSPAPNSPIRTNPRLNVGYLLAEGVKVPLTWLFNH